MDYKFKYNHPLFLHHEMAKSSCTRFVMDSFLFLNVKGILRETFKIFGKSGRLMSYVTISTLCITSLLYLSNFFSIKPLVADLLIDQKSFLVTDPNSSQFSNLLTRAKHHLSIFFGIELLYLVVNTIAFTLVTAVTILVSALTHGSNKEIYFKDLLSSATKPWMRVLVTWLWSGVFDVAFFVIFVSILAPTLAILHHPYAQLAAAVLLCILAIVLYLDVAVVWNLALVVSTVEEIRGPTAFKKAYELVKGLKKEGFLLNLGFIIICLVLIQGMRVMSPQKGAASWPVVDVVVGLVGVNCERVVRMLRLMAFTVYYYQCKKTHGEAVQLEATIDGYYKIPADIAPLQDQDIV